MSFDEINEILASEAFAELKNIKITGFMGMATFTDNKKQLEEEFSSLNTFFNELKTQYPSLKTLSMGMSGDYMLAIENGSNMVRVGSSIFGQRNYNA